MIWDSLIVGAGPAGLTAAIYLARFRRRALVIDGGASRASLVPVSHNLAGFPEGVRGPDMLSRMSAQARRYGAIIRAGEVAAIRPAADGNFSALVDGEEIRSHTILLATGVIDIEPDMPDIKGAIARGLVRYCPVCDGFEVIDRKVGVIGHGSHGLNEAVFLRGFSDDVTLLSVDEPLRLDDDERRRADNAGIKIIAAQVSSIAAGAQQIEATTTPDHAIHRFDAIYAALGTKPRSSLAREIGAAATEDGCLITTAHQQTSVKGVFAAGDIVKGLSQISVAMGEAAIAATAIHNLLRGEEVR